MSKCTRGYADLDEVAQMKLLAATHPENLPIKVVITEDARLHANK